MLKYAMKWEMDGRSGVVFYINDFGNEFKVSEDVFNSVECPNLGFKHIFFDREKKTKNVSYSMAAD